MSGTFNIVIYSGSTSGADNTLIVSGHFKSKPHGES